MTWLNMLFPEWWRNHCSYDQGDEYKKLAVSIWAYNLSMSFEKLYDKSNDYEIYLIREERMTRSIITV